MLKRGIKKQTITKQMVKLFYNVKVPVNWNWEYTCTGQNFAFASDQYDDFKHWCTGDSR